MSKKRILLFLPVLALFVLLFQNFTNTSTAVSRTDHRVEHIGFYATAYDVDYILEAKNFGNLIHIDHSSGNKDFIIASLRKAKANQKKAIVSVQHIFYNCSNGCVLASASDYNSRWSALATAIKSASLESTIFSFYLDEPELNNGRMIGNTAHVVPNLEIVSRTVKASFRNAKMQMTSAWLDVKEEMQLPVGFDIFGMDCYADWDLCGNSTYKLSIPQYYEILEQKIVDLERRDGKKRYMALFPPTFYSTVSHPDYPSESKAKWLFQKYMDFSKTNPRFIAVIGFLWPNQYEHHTQTQLYGAKVNSSLRELMRIEYDKIRYPQPRILSSGRGCSDNLCLWVRSDFLHSTHEVRIRDPQNYAAEMIITSAHSLLETKGADGVTAISFRIPPEAESIYRNRGLDIVLVNKFSSTIIKMNAVKSTRP